MRTKSSYLSRARVERVIGVVRVGLATASLFAVWMDPTEPERYTEFTYSMYASYLAYSVVLAVIMWRKDSTGRWPIVTQIADIAVASVLQYLTLGPSSPFFVYFIFALFCGALRWGWRGTVVVATVVLAAFVVISAWLSHTLGPTDSELNRFIIRVTYLVVIAVVLVYLGQHEEQMRLELRRLARWPVSVSGPSDVVAGQVLAYSADVVGAARARLVWGKSDEPWCYTTSLPGPIGVFERHPPDTFEPLVVAPLSDLSFVSEADGAGHYRLHVGYDAARPESETPIHPALAASLGTAAVASAPFRTDEVSGRVFFAGCMAEARDLLPLVEIVARDIGWSIDQALAAERQRAQAVTDDRVRVARDLHDGVLQSLTGIRLELQAIAHEETSPLPLSERLVGIERALSLEQRELRRFIQDLKPEPAFEPTGPSLTDRLDDLRRRLVLEWRTPVSIAIHPHDLAMPPAFDRDVPLMVHEGIVNALKHGRPTHVSVEVRLSTGALTIAIADDGSGFPFVGRHEHATLAAANAGPVSLRERVAALGGRIAVESTAEGSRVELSLPFEITVG